MIYFDTIYIPRAENGEVSPGFACDICGAKTTVYLTIKHTYNKAADFVCRGCLGKGIKMICDRMIKEYADV